MRHTSFNPSKLQAIIDRLWDLAPPNGLHRPVIATYEQFANSVPKTTPDEYSAIASAAFERHADTPYYVGGSSGTTSKVKLVLTRVPVPGSIPSEEDKVLIGQLLRQGVFKKGDVVLNGFTVGLFSLLHHSMNRVLDACRVTIVPLGAPDEPSMRSQLELLARCGTNVLVGTPGTLVQLANAVLRNNVSLRIERIAFTGERLGPVKAALLQAAFPGVRIVGLYGTSECGFIAVGDEGQGTYAIFDESYFLEVDEDDRLLVTALDASQPVPIVRYAPGDRVTLYQRATGPALRHIQRANLDFNFMGNLVDLARLRSVIEISSGTTDPAFEAELRTGPDGRDHLTLRLFGPSEPTAYQAGAIRDDICQLPEIREALEKNAGTIDVVGGGDVGQATLTGRRKHQQIIDLRR